jgi:hypothetical protein
MQESHFAGELAKSPTPPSMNNHIQFGTTLVAALHNVFLLARRHFMGDSL